MTWATFRQTKRFRVLLASVTLAVILGITVPVVAFFVIRQERNRNATPKASVLVPLYVYPSAGAWSPLLNVINLYPEVDFTVIVNPNNGPGGPTVPDGNYTTAIPELTAFSNVRVLGYVATTYSKRDIKMVLADVATYAAWSGMKEEHPGLGVKGIFFDEAPSQYDARSVQYLDSLKQAVKDSTGLGPDNYVIHNPGSIPDQRYMASADCTVVFEETYNTYLTQNSAKALAALPDNRNQLCLVMHSVPTNISKGNFIMLVDSARKVAGSVYMTDLSVNYYSAFSSRLNEFVANMASK